MTAAAQRGTTTVSERAVRRIAERAATETLPAPGGARTARAAASVRGRRAKVSLGVTLPYPAPLADTVREVQRHVVERTRELTGLEVPAARISVIALATPTSAQPLVSPAEDTIATSAPWRWWSQRRVPVAVLTSVAALGCGALALDMVQVHTAHLPAAAWRTSAVHWLAGHGPGDPGVVVAGGLTALIGIWMVILALTPGRRHQSTVRTSANHVDAAVDRSAVQALVRDAVGDVEGIAAVRIRVRRRRVTVRAGLAFGDRAGAHAAATAAARAALTACHLRRAPRLRVVVTPEPVWQPPAPTADVTADATGATPGDDDGRSTPASALAPATGGDR
ncbi:DUF6286 domain-containing Asp23/Gls24 family envelope stress response protein [Streptomyces phaeochromogenes]|uniref:DUF6286 domain-containing Asp23/Gls24 family envelope stress response protein n=1 Tax=Streptomyces phaeochromogenes TaxID=1923 RepID=UPI0038635177|nr:alkaline shock response membrane anchor protein AmaP [Streptomyces phaeochromogenes]